MRYLVIIVLLLAVVGVSGQQMVYGEYFFDTKRSYGEGTSIPISGNSSSIDLDFTVNTANLEDGLHTLFVRFRDSDNKWTQTLHFPVFIRHARLLQIQRGEYFFDEQVAYGQGTPLNVSDLQEAVTISQVIEAPATLSPGSHLLFYRFQDNRGQWSQTFTENVCLNVVSGTYSLDADQYCFDEVVGFLYSSTEVPNASYNWDFDNDGNFNDYNSVGENFTYTPLSADNDTTIFRYHISSGLCPDWSKVDTLSTVISSEIIVQLEEVDPEINSEMNGGIAVNTSGGIAPYTYQWFVEDNLIAVTEDITNLSAGSYTLLVADGNDCTTMVEVEVDNLVNSTTIEAAVSISVFPNPSSSYMIVEFGKVPAEDGWLQLINGQGQEVLTKKWKNGTQNARLDLSSFPAGCYYLVYRSSELVRYYQVNVVH